MTVVMQSDKRRRANIRLAILLGVVALFIFIAFMWSIGAGGK
jgi:hypothetical protein